MKSDRSFISCIVCRYGEDDNVKILLDAGTPVNFQVCLFYMVVLLSNDLLGKDEDGSTALHKAAANGEHTLFTALTCHVET